jgi:hypothetical protein
LDDRGDLRYYAGDAETAKPKGCISLAQDGIAVYFGQRLQQRASQPALAIRWPHTTRGWGHGPRQHQGQMMKGGMLKGC